MMYRSPGSTMALKFLLTSALLVGLLLPAYGPAAFSPADRRCLNCHEDVAKQITSHAVHAEAGVSCVSCHRDDFSRRAPHRGTYEPVRCVHCHEDTASDRPSDRHAALDEAGRPTVACVDCHGTHDIRSAKDPQSPTYHLNVPLTCAGCHGGADAHMDGDRTAPLVAGAYADGVHGHALEARGMRAAPNCVSCHGVHQMLPADDPDSPISPLNIDGTCRSCHEGTTNAFRGGQHGRHRQAGGNQAPTCSDCHSPHLTLATGTPEWKLQGIQQCGTCHEKETLTYRDTFHGKVTSLGFVRVATCADCHGAHEILPRSDPRSPIAPKNLMETCGNCHTRLNENFVRYNPHANYRDREAEPVLYWSATFMHGLLVGVFGLFGLHTLLWAWRGWRTRLGRGTSAGNDATGD